MSISSKSFDASFLSCHGYTFGTRINKKLLWKVKFGNKTLACKIIQQKKNENEKRLEILKLISHPSIISIHSILQNGKFAFVFTLWNEDGNLKTYLREKGAVKEWKANFWFYQIVCAVKYLHAMNVAHCNLRCESVMISNVRAKLLCLNHIEQSSGEKISLKTSQSSTNFYFPPDVNKGLPCDAKKIDLFALGVILFMMVNATVPFVNEDLPLLIDDQIKRRFFMRASMINELSVDCQVMIHTLLEPKEETRWCIEKIYKMKFLSRFIHNHGDC